MTKKRFKLEKKFFDGYCIVDTMEEGYCTYDKQDLEKHCEKINTLFDEYERLRKDCTILVYSNQEYRKENEQLKNENKELKEQLDSVTQLIGKVNWKGVIDTLNGLVE